jgi:diacylglycerol kinase (ATP)
VYPTVWAGHHQVEDAQDREHCCDKCKGVGIASGEVCEQAENAGSAADRNEIETDGDRQAPRPPRTIDALGAKVPGSAETSHRTGSWNVVRSGYHAFSGLMWVTPRTPSIRLGIAVVIVLSAGGFLLRFTSVEIALLVLVGTLLIAVETINTSIEMLCDFVEPKHDPKIGKIKDVAAGATAVTEIGGALTVAILLWPHVWAAIHR